MLEGACLPGSPATARSRSGRTTRAAFHARSSEAGSLRASRAPTKSKYAPSTPQRSFTRARAPHPGAPPGPRDQVMERDDERHRRPAGQAEVDGVIEGRPDALEVGPQRHRLLVGGELSVVAAP